MGFMIIKESTTITPSRLGITKITPVTVICVGSGAGSRPSMNGATIYYQGVPAGTADKIHQYCGGAGGGYGAGAGGISGAGNNTSIYVPSTRGGGAGKTESRTFVIDDPDMPIPVTVAERGAAASNGSASSFGLYLTAAGGLMDGGGNAGSHFSDGTNGYYCGGAGGGAGGYQIGAFMNGGQGGDGATVAGAYINAKDGIGTGGGGGGTIGPNQKPIGGKGGRNGGGKGWSYPNETAQDGYAYLGEAGKGLVLLFW